VSKSSSVSVVFLFLPFLITGCLGKDDPKTDSGFEPPAPLSIRHNSQQCPALSGTYVREYDDNGKTQTLKMEIKLEKEGGQLLFTDMGGEKRVVDGQSHKSKDGLLDYQIGCSEGILTVQDSSMGKPLGELKYDLQGDELIIQSKSLDESVLILEAGDVHWKLVTSGQEEAQSGGQ
jgi:hypothetical protein